MVWHRGVVRRPSWCWTETERQTLVRWATAAQSRRSRWRWRSRIVLACGDGLDNIVVAGKLGVNQATVRKWRWPVHAPAASTACVDRTPAGRAAHDYRRRRRAGDRQDARGKAGQRHALVDTGSGQAVVGMSPSVGRPHLAGLRAQAVADRHLQTLARTPLFIDKVRDVVGLYLNPPDKAVVLCVDEKTGIQALDRTQPDPADAAGPSSSGEPTTTSATGSLTSSPR